MGRRGHAVSLAGREHRTEAEETAALVIEPLRLSYEIDCSPEHAFAVWTTSFSTWWPKGHSASGNPDTVVVLEPRHGGRIFERTPDGTEIDWGEVTLWSPPRRFGYQWHITRDRSDATDVELTFVDLGNDKTRLDIVHSGWERLGADAPAFREANTSGWNALIPNFVVAAEA
jgi:Activator of Hsp90 ATPase homolog 1-like protein